MVSLKHGRLPLYSQFIENLSSFEKLYVSTKFIGNIDRLCKKRSEKYILALKLSLFPNYVLALTYILNEFNKILIATFPVSEEALDTENRTSVQVLTDKDRKKYKSVLDEAKISRLDDYTKLCDIFKGFIEWDDKVSVFLHNPEKIVNIQVYYQFYKNGLKVLKNS